MSVFLSKCKVILVSGACQGFGSYQAARQSSPYITRAKHSSLFPLITLNPNPNLSSPLQSPASSDAQPLIVDPAEVTPSAATGRRRTGDYVLAGATRRCRRGGEAMWRPISAGNNSYIRDYTFPSSLSQVPRPAHVPRTDLVCHPCAATNAMIASIKHPHCMYKNNVHNVCREKLKLQKQFRWMCLTKLI